MAKSDKGANNWGAQLLSKNPMLYREQLADARRYFQPNARAVRLSLSTRPHGTAFRKFQISRHWSTQFSVDDVEELHSILMPRISNELDRIYFIINLEQTVFGLHQVNLWRELDGLSRDDLHIKLDSLIGCVEQLRAAMVPDSHLMLPAHIASVSEDTAVVSQVHQSLQALLDGIRLRQSSMERTGALPQSARSFVAVLIAAQLDRIGIKPTWYPGNEYLLILQVALFQQGEDDTYRMSKGKLCLVDVDGVGRSAVKEYRRDIKDRNNWGYIFRPFDSKKRP